MRDTSRVVETLQRDLSDLKRQISRLADTVADMGDQAPVREALHLAGRRAAWLGDEAQRAARQHPLASGLAGIALLGAVVYLASLAAREQGRRRW